MTIAQLTQERDAALELAAQRLDQLEKTQDELAAARVTISETQALLNHADEVIAQKEAAKLETIREAAEALAAAQRG